MSRLPFFRTLAGNLQSNHKVETALVRGVNFKGCIFEALTDLVY